MIAQHSSQVEKRVVACFKALATGDALAKQTDQWDGETR